MATSSRSWPDVAIPPGEVLAETLETLGITQAELARRAGRPVQAVNEIVRGGKEITPETALQLERVLGVPAHIWVRLEADYQFVRARTEDRVQLQREVPVARRYPYTAMAKLGWVKQTRDPVEKVRELLFFFGVASLKNIPLTQSAAFRRSSKVSYSKEALAAWLRQGEREASKLENASYNASALRSLIPKIRGLTTRPPNIFEPQLRGLLASVGVALVIIPHLPKTGAQGATWWRHPNKAVLQMSIRYKWDDIFWFGLMHELGHVLLHGKTIVFIEGIPGTDTRLEREADSFAAEQLIPAQIFERFKASRPRPSRNSVVRFAGRIGIAPSIVVGRLQHEKILPPSHLNGLRSRFKLAGGQ